jgi:hypothetical protein
MSFYFPLGGTSGVSVQNISHSLLAVTASVPTSTTITVLTTLFATNSGSNPPAGTSGASATVNDCNPALYVSGAAGPQGPTGSNGADNVTCPAGTILCAQASVSLSGAFTYNMTSYPNGINGTLPSGSQYSIVCMEIPPGCTNVNTICPPYLPMDRGFPTII